MAVRRSARIRNQETQEPVAVPVQQPAAVEAGKTKKRKAPATKTEEDTKSKKQATQSAIGKGRGKTKAKLPPVQSQLSSNDGTLSSLPPEILHMILDNITHKPTIGKLGRASKAYHALMMPRLHKRLAVAAMFHAHISKLIRALEPHLTIAQKKQLKKEGKYKGQQERYSTLLDEHSKPFCADCVRQIVVGVADPGRKHKYIVERYVEEGFKNMTNLEIIETRMLTESMGQSIAALKNLQALRLFASDFRVEAMRPLAKLKNLKHLSLEDHGFSSHAIGDDHVLRSMIQNSTSTLQSLDVAASSYLSNFLEDWEKKVPAVADQSHDLTALKSLALSDLSFDATFIKSLQRAIDFMGLRELKLGHLSEGKHLFFDHLTSLTSSRPTGAGIGLRSLFVKMSKDSYGQTPGQNQADLEAKYRFISSFDTLTALELEDYNQYSDLITTNPGLSDALLQAILKHENLTCLKISYTGVICGCKIPYLSAATVATIIDNLPHLQEFEFAPEEPEIEEIGKVLSRGTNLTSITCFPHLSWADAPQSNEEPGFNILSGIVKGFLSRDADSGSGRFIWEEHYKLKRVSVNYRSWDVASKFGQAAKGMKKAEKIKSDGDGKREVLYRDITGTFPQRIHVGFDPEYEWVERVAKDND
ncbi:hypothetical protein B0T10DRAFT_324881 [Thelonectria olida]|uniref:Uncharacterized protein n=1 Tax=Thelonectria olida TaxID=1576542 RepID=A0A9P8W5F9_9HYPO|nr:hypothetical protein B0T10DRAFT_324881 [Thelonectria olida]